MVWWVLRKMRDAGRRRTFQEIESDPGLVGQFRLSYNGPRAYRALTFYPKTGTMQTPGVGLEQTIVLYEPQIVGFGQSGVRLRGFERHDGAAVAQEWLCDVYVHRTCNRR